MDKYFSFIESTIKKCIQILLAFCYLLPTNPVHGAKDRNAVEASFVLSTIYNNFWSQ